MSARAWSLVSVSRGVCFDLALGYHGLSDRPGTLSRTPSEGKPVPHVWIDPVNCMGAGTCEQVAPAVFTARSDGLWAVKEDGRYFGSTTVFDGRPGDGHGPEGLAGRARIPDGLLDLVIEAAEECPGECIFVEA